MDASAFGRRFLFGVNVMYMLKTSADFDSAHFLFGYNGKCANIHGHHWVIEVMINSEALVQNGEKRGMVIDFGNLKHEVRALADSFDHSLIFESGTLKNKTLEALREEKFSLIEVMFRPTAENFARHFYYILKKKGLPIKSVAVYETPDNCAVYEEG